MKKFFPRGVKHLRLHSLPPLEEILNPPPRVCIPVFVTTPLPTVKELRTERVRKRLQEHQYHRESIVQGIQRRLSKLKPEEELDLPSFDTQLESAEFLEDPRISARRVERLRNYHQHKYRKSIQWLQDKQFWHAKR